jgi:selenocysteine lyase/cysteine desulfurase
MSEEYMDEINVRILRVTEDLRAIQQELNCAAMQAPSNPELMENLSRISETESLQVLQSAIDQMRHFLWFYGQILTGEPAVSEHLRERSRTTRPVAAQQAGVSEKTAWPSETTLIRMLADGRNRKPN